MHTPIVALCEEKALVRNTERHRLIAELFCDRLDYTTGEKERHPSTAQYLKDRVVVELALAVAKAKGFVTATQLDRSRVGEYLRHWTREGPNDRQTLYSLCAQLGLVRVGYSREALRISETGATGNPLDDLTIEDDDWNTARDVLLTKALAMISPARRERAQSQYTKKIFEEVLDAMYWGDEVEVSLARESPYDIWFRQPLPFASLLATKVYTRHILARDGWDRLLCVAETGSWLVDQRIVEVIAGTKGRRLSIIVADRAYETKLTKIYEQSEVEINIRRLPWWLHNQHMTVITGGGEPLGAVYFERRHRALTISPVGLDDPGDLRIVLDNYLAYWLKAKKHMENRNIFLVNRQEIDDARRDLM